MFCPAQVFFSNSSDAHLHLFRSQLQQNQGNLPTHRTMVITPNQLVKKILQKELLAVSEEGVVSGIIFLEFAPAIVKLFRMVLGRDPKIPSKGLLSLHLEKILANYDGDPKIVNYLSENPLARIPPLAERLAGVFLEVGKTGILDQAFKKTWQGKLFFEVFSRFDFPTSLVEASFQKPKVQYALHLFGFQYIPPVYHRLFKRLEQFFPITLYQLSPTPEYWGDQTKFLDKENAHPLLQAFGTVLRKTTDTITDLGYEVSDLFLQQREKSALSTLKESIAHVKPINVEPDESIQLHATQSLGRGIDVAYHIIAERIISGVAKPDDFLLLFNDIESATPDIHRLFGSVEAPLPYQIYEVPSEVTGGIYATFMQFFSLFMGRVTYDDLTLFLEKNEVMEQFDLTMHDLHQIESWLKKLHFRWGISKVHRSHFLPNTEDVGTFESALHSLAYAFMKAQRRDSIQSNTHAPLSLETVDLALLNTLYTIKETLSRFASFFHLNRSCSIGTWKKEIYDMVGELFGKTGGAQPLYQFCESLFEHMAPEEEFTAQSVFRYFEKALEKKKGIYGASTLNGVICAPLKAENVISKKHIFLFGLEDEHFPKEEKESSFEIEGMHKEYAPSRTDEASASLLSAILHAKSMLWLQYTSTHVEDGKAMAPSALLEVFGLSLKEHSSTRFLMPVSPTLVSTKKMTVAHSKPLRNKVFAPAFYEEQLLIPLPEKVWDIGMIRQFLTHPLRAYTQNTLGLYLERDEGAYEEKEFALHPLDKYILRKEGGIEKADTLGLFPTGSLKQLHKLQLISEECDQKKLLEQINVKRLYTIHFREDCHKKTPLSHELLLLPSLTMGPYRLHGYVPNVADDRLIIFDTPANALKYWADILSFAAWMPQGTVFFTASDASFDVPEGGLFELLTYISCVQKTPSPLLPSFFTAIVEKDEKAFERRVKQVLSGFTFDDPYVSKYFTKDSYSLLIEKWHHIVMKSFTPFIEWVSNARV